ncbi:receptor-like protein kinase FERONIA [Senna tora]|uniref:Receptor-like protein kinase FERONIA n=1 Tax=Senna tora TaxID=362788 RepID=A0A834WML7_9FABA|nr:receptor-like protein kinase FERONIA [Senna tora]
MPRKFDLQVALWHHLRNQACSWSSTQSSLHVAKSSNYSLSIDVESIEIPSYQKDANNMDPSDSSSPTLLLNDSLQNCSKHSILIHCSPLLLSHESRYKIQDLNPNALIPCTKLFPLGFSLSTLLINSPPIKSRSNHQRETTSIESNLQPFKRSVKENHSAPTMVMMMISCNKKPPGTTTNPTTILFSFLLFIISVHSYQPKEDLVIICGTSTPPSNTPNDQNRTWIADDNIHSHQLFSLIQSPHSQTATSSSLPSSASQNLYASARLSHTQFTYSFHLSDGPKFLRLHFYPTSYLNFPRFNSLFSVTSNNFTLLNHFNASLVADHNAHETVSTEFSIHVDPRDHTLNVTFTPANNLYYAFINAIEIVSMPNYLYFIDPTRPGFPLLGLDLNLNYQDFQIGNTTALETAYRIKAGGQGISPERDAGGMFRSWDSDVDFLKSVGESSDLPFDMENPLNYSAIPNYTAPDEVYRTGRSYGQDQKSREYNVTWEFEVVSEFDYFVRLHFCEVDPAVNDESQRVFQIFIADALAESHADVVLWSGGRMVPYYRDYAVRFQNPSLDRRINLSIKLQPHPDYASIYFDVLLNGIEIFKLSESNGNLAVLNPKPGLEPRSPPPSVEKSSSETKTTMIGIVVGAASALIVVLSVLAFIIFRRRYFRAESGHYKSSKSKGSSLPSDLCRCFSITEIKAATNNFDDLLKIGVGGFGNVYKGYIDNHTVPVAIKRLKPGSQQGAHEFQTEIEMLSQLRHLHLVSLIGYCNDGNEMILVYEFMARGTLRDHLYDSDNQPLSWKQRLEICLGAARGLHYLHTGAKHNIIHRDVKATNILIDEKWSAKVSDFGLSKVGPTGMSRSHISTVVKGSMGYLDPEYYKRQRLTQKSDVYSFGVVLLEVLCGRPPLLRTVEKQRMSLVEWVRKCHGEGVIQGTVDASLLGSITPECLKAFSEMALKCLVEDGNERPSMNDVVWGLEFALELQESMGEKELQEAIVEARHLLEKGKYEEEEEESEMRFTSSEGTGSESKSSKMTISSTDSGMVFSELRNPSER